MALLKIFEEEIRLEKRDLMKDLEIVEKATPGPWIDYARYGDSSIYGHEIRLGDEDGPILAEDVSANNARFITEAREGWPEAIRRAIEAEAKVESLEKDLFRTCAYLHTSEEENEKLRAEIFQLRAEIQFHIDLLESVAEAVKEGAENEEEAERSYNMGKSAAYLTVAKNLQEILDGKTE